MTEALPPENPEGFSMRKLTHIVYGLFALGLIAMPILGLGIIAAVVVAYIKRSDAAGTVYAQHFDWMLSTFWWGLLFGVVSYVAHFIFIGWITGVVTVIWVIYRIARGWLALCSGNAPQAIVD